MDLISEKIEATGIKIDKLVEILGVSRSSFWRKRYNVESFSVKEMTLLSEILDLNETEVFQIFLPKMFHKCNERKKEVK